MNKDLAQKAIQEALCGNWENAIIINKQLLKNSPKDIDTLNRLARAYSETGNLKKAKSIAQKVIILDPTNSIAQKALDKWKMIKKANTYNFGPAKPQTFLEEPGKTKIVTLINPGDIKLLAKLDSGDEVKLKTHGHKISVTTKDGKYIGRLPDDLSARLKTLISLKCEYAAYIKSINKNEVRLFIRETNRGSSCKDIPSFSSEKIDYISFTPPELVHKRDSSFHPEEVIEEE